MNEEIEDIKTKIAIYTGKQDQWEIAMGELKPLMIKMCNYIAGLEERINRLEYKIKKIK